LLSKEREKRQDKYQKRMLLKLRIMNKRHCKMKKEKEMNILLKITKRMMERNKKSIKKKNRKK